MIHAGTKVWHKDQRQSDLPPEPVISKTNPLASTNRVGAVRVLCSIPLNASGFPSLIKQCGRHDLRCRRIG